MQTMVGTIIKRNNKILMIQEGKVGSSCYGEWNFPSGHLEENENIFDGAMRETLEETGYRVKLKKVYPIQHIYYKGERIRFFFLADIIDKVENFHPTDILNVKWRDIEKIKRLGKDLRDTQNNLKLLDKIEREQYYSLEFVCDLFENKQ